MSADEISGLKSEGEIDLAYQRALHFLGYRPRSEAETERYLGNKGYPADLVAMVLERLQSKGYLDDYAFARFWVENRSRFRPRGPQALRYELRQKGIAPAVIDVVLERQDEAADAWSAVEGKLLRWRSLDQAEFDKKVFGFLQRRGFSYSICQGVCRRARAQVQED